MTVIDKKRKTIKIDIGKGCVLSIPIAVWGRPHDFKKAPPNKKCCWPIDDLHEGVVWLAPLFDGQIIVPICTHHLTGHRVIISLHSAGYDMDHIFDIDSGEREKLCANIKLVPWDDL